MNSPFGTPKILRYPAHLAAWQRGRTPPPVTVELDLTAACNHRCPACGGGSYGGGHMPAEDARRLLVEMALAGVRGVLLTGGGEPTVHPEFAELLEWAAQLMPVGLMTNGSRIGANTALAEAVALQCRWVRVSIDASDAETYWRVHGMPADEFARAWQAVAMLADARRRHASGSTVGVSYMVSATSWPHMERAALMARDAGADYIQFRPFWGQAIPIDAALEDCQRYATDSFRVLSAAQKYDRLDQPRGYTTCHGSHFAGVIQADGQMPLCCNLRGRPEWYLGNVREDGFRAVWTGPRRAELLARLDVARCVPLCRLDAINPLLEEIARPMEHEEFL